MLIACLFCVDFSLLCTLCSHSKIMVSSIKIECNGERTRCHAFNWIVNQFTLGLRIGGSVRNTRAQLPPSPLPTLGVYV